MQYYKEAIEWLNKYSDKAEVTQTIASCYSKIGDMLFNLGREDPGYHIL
ncbi:MAG: hypothetical protein AB8U82_02535 [Rickettsia endosymbiont of Haemaphysalis japonica]